MDFPGGASSSGAGQASEQQLMDEVTLRVLLHQLYLLRVSQLKVCVLLTASWCSWLRRWRCG
jgi:hypothetical protein